MEKGEAGQIIYSQLIGIRHDNAIRSRDSNFIAKGRVLGKRPADGRGQVKSEDAQGGREVDHFRGLKERKVKFERLWLSKGVSNKRMNSVSSQRVLLERTLSKRMICKIRQRPEWIGRGKLRLTLGVKNARKVEVESQFDSKNEKKEEGRRKEEDEGNWR